MNDKKAPAYEEAARHLDEIFVRTLTFPSVRELKAKCGDVGSLSTYQAYKDRWVEDRLAGSGVEAVLMAMRMERDAHASVMTVLHGRLARLLQMFPGAKGISGDEADDVDDVEEDAGPSQDRGDGVDRDITIKDESSEHHRRVSERVRTVAQQSEARFTDNDDIDAASAASTGTPRPNAFGRDNADPIDQAFPSNEHASPSRNSGGGQQVTHPTETTKPASGEGDTIGGRENSRD